MNKYLFPVRNGRKWGFINELGDMVRTPQYESANATYEGIAWYRCDGKYGFIEHNGDILCEPVFDKVDSFCEGLCCALRGGKLGYINRQLEFVFLHSYSKCLPFREGLAVGYNESLNYDYIDKNGGIVLKGNFRLGECSGGLICFKETLKTKHGYKSKTGEWVITPRYDLAGDFAEGLAAVQVSKKGKMLTGFIDAGGGMVMPPQFNAFDTRFSQGRALIVRAGKYGFIDRNGAEVIPCKFDLADHFSEGMAWVEVKGKVGFINASGNMVIRPGFDLAEPFRNGLAWVRVRDREGYIDQKGNILYLGAI